MADTEPQSHLDDDFYTVPGQLLAVVSFVAPTGTNQRNDKFGLKIRGCFASKEEANAHVKRLQQFDKIMDIYLVDMYKWLLIPPDPNAIDDQEYQEEFLGNLIKGYKENQVLAKQHFEERREAVKKDGLDPHLLEHEKLPPPQAVTDTQAEAAVDRALFEEQDPLMARKAVTDTQAEAAVDRALFEEQDPLMARKGAAEPENL